MTRIHGWKSACAVFLVCLAAASAALAGQYQIVTTLANFDGTTTGHESFASLVQGLDGSFYGTTFYGGANQMACGGANQACGTVFQLTALGKLTVLYNFCSQTNCADGVGPEATTLVQDSTGNLYGTTVFGGANSGNCPLSQGCGTVFKITPKGALTTLYSFCTQPKCADGSEPSAGLLQVADGDLYGTTALGGTGAGGTCVPIGASIGCGTAFKITRQGTLTTLYNFCTQSNCTDGISPSTPLVLGTDGNFYGTTLNGGETSSPGQGTVFRMTPTGKLTTLADFCTKTSCFLGSSTGGLVQATDGNFYGTTQYAAFRVTPGGELTGFPGFNCVKSSAEGCASFGQLIQATDGNLYGTTVSGGVYPKNCQVGAGCGTLFKMSLSGTVTYLVEFCTLANCADGSTPFAGLIQSTSGNIFGTTSIGGTSNLGTLFRYHTGLGPFVETKPTYDKVGAKILILGNNLQGATSVTFNGVAATFTAGNTVISTTIPAGATTGTVQVTTPSGTLSSNVAFRVIP